MSILNLDFRHLPAVIEEQQAHLTHINGVLEARVDIYASRF